METESAEAAPAVEWLTDVNGNKCSVAYFGTAEAAQRALDSLRGCKNCTNCSDCTNCADCAGCTNCIRCADCTGCIRCMGCSGCSGKKSEKGDFAPPAVPKIENIHARVLAAVEQPAALDMSTWHSCHTTHCRAGWVVHLAGDAGYALEKFHGTAFAAQLIYRESSPKLPVSPVRFYETNEAAMADIRRMAELEKSNV